MASTALIEVSKLSLDLNNFRTVPQKKEQDAIKAMIALKPERFYAIMESLLDDGYLPTENIIVLKDGTENIVREGNRRIAAMKIIHGIYKSQPFGIPASIEEQISNLDAKWKLDNAKVPCTIYTSREVDLVDKIIDLAHAKGEKASRVPWNSVARARHNRDIKKVPEPGLDILEKYIKKGQNINNQQKERWGSEYPLTVLDEALRKISPRLGFMTIAECASKYPNIPHRAEVEEILRAIGLELIDFKIIRSTDFATPYGIPQPMPSGSNTAPNTNNSTSTNSTTTTTATTTTSPAHASSGTAPAPTSTTNVSNPLAPKAYASNDPRHVLNILKKFNPSGVNREKVVGLKNEALNLKIAKTPIAFCFILRSMFEISAKAYANDHSIPTTNANGTYDRPLKDLLRDITNHITGNQANMAMVKVLHGAMTEIAKPDGILSITSMNQLVHNPSFNIVSSDMCIVFGNIYPLLEAMN